MSNTPLDVYNLQHKQIGDLTEELTRLRAELAGARKDTERYRWLRQSAYAELYLHNQPNVDSCKCISDESLDAAIDAALQKEQP